jgi:hypothetical protein
VRVALLLSVSVIVGCASKVEGTLQVDGAPFQVERCRSGAALGFPGIALVHGDGRSIRLLASQRDGSVAAALIPAGAAVGIDLGPCGSIELREQSSNVNNIQNQQGSATLSCEREGHQLSGSIRFENCH